MFLKLRYIFSAVILIVILLLAGCSKEVITPYEKLQTYIDHWNDKNFQEMYALLTVETKAQYSTEDFVDRYEKIYNDIKSTNLQVSYKELSDANFKLAIEEGSTIIPIEVKMDSIAGPIHFSNQISLQFVEEDDAEKSDWYIDWNNDLILSGLKDNGQVVLKTERPKRGEILDRNRMPLAINDVVFDVGIVPELFQNENNEKAQIAQLLNTTVSAIDSKLNASWVEPHLFVPIKSLPKAEEHKLTQLINIPSITTKEATGRAYPSGEAAAHLTGYVGQITPEELAKQTDIKYGENDMIGKRGLEQLFEKQLKGEDGIKIIISNEDEADIIVTENPVTDGEHIIVTIDVNIQEKIFNSYEGESGTAVAIGPKSGDILALVSSPSFDPNEMLFGISQTKWDSLQNNPKQPLINRFTATYAPGSAIKPITASIGLKNGTINPNEGIEINGLTWGKKAGWGDYKVKRVSTSEKPVDLKDALIRSDNIYFAMQAVKMGNKSFIDGLKQFGLEEQLPVVYPFKTSQISNDGNLINEVLLANTSYGQGEIELSALHLAIAYTPFFNKGNLIKPNLLADEASGEVWKQEVISESDAKLMQQYLESVVSEGTAGSAKNEKVQVSGKTGTVELKMSIDTKGHENGWFVGYPTVEQDILIAMMVEETENIGSSSYVAKKVADILIDLQ